MKKIFSCIVNIFDVFPLYITFSVSDSITEDVEYVMRLEGQLIWSCTKLSYSRIAINLGQFKNKKIHWSYLLMFKTSGTVQVTSSALPFSCNRPAQK